MTVVEKYYGPNGPGEIGEKFDASSFLGFLRRSQPLWLPETGVGERQQWVYRGHWDHRWPLVPSAARPIGSNKLTQIIQKKRNILDSCSSWQDIIPNAKNVAAYIAAHAHAMRRFMLLGNEMGLVDDDAIEDINLQELPVLASGYREVTGSFLDHGCLHGGNMSSEQLLPGNRASITALAQHHGIPTFLLDWTENPWNAAFFATTSPDQLKD